MILKNQLAGNTWATAPHTEAFCWFYCGPEKCHPLFPWRIQREFSKLQATQKYMLSLERSGS